MDELTEGAPSPQEMEQLLNRALIGAVHLGEMIDNMLDHALAEGAELHLEPLSLGGPGGLVSDVGDLLGVPSLEVRGPSGPIVRGDEHGVRQLLASLLGNAVKYAAPERPLHVHVDIERRASRVVVTVSDNGRGIPEHEHETVFEPFSRAGTAGTVAGTGIGLTLCRLVVERHGGTISCASGPTGVGTTFTFDLPAD
ncbi:sensor histidine kinase [Nocardioides okcheonensis]|uniref:sensor histidine kinase n=1 Tax=Nocardioides okcheonensis TaxID=2894081 RepID=UPI001E3386F5|nr:HAMP domain-containing sensor histidine kinase [Nocardioides okcheonensis]UFN45116.1 HAMP domain-containing histidine kinase [Nocardioides okcheonensis]